MNDVAVLGSTGKVLMPTSRAKARILLKKERAVIERYTPVFTIRLTDRENGDVQPVELKVDTGYQHIGVSVCSEKHEYLSRQYDLLTNETERHRDCRQYRRQRRNRKRYRQPRFDNRKGMLCKDGFAPSIRNRRDRHVDIIRSLCEVFPVTTVIAEMGNFDTQVLKAVAEGKPVPQGTDYQHGEQYGAETLRQAIFLRDNYTCQCCGRTPFQDNAILHIHHIGFWKEDRTNRPGNLMTVCEKCHTSKNHRPGGKLFGLEPKLKPLKEATFMTSVRWDMLKRIRKVCPGVDVQITYGVATKASRKDLNLPKSHANDAYAMGRFHPKHRTQTEIFRKKRRNNRILEKFYDAKYVDIRTGRVRKASELGCNRTKRCIPRNNGQNERCFRGNKKSNGRRSIRKQRYEMQPGTILKTPFGKRTAKGVHCNGTRVIVEAGNKTISIPIGKCRIVRYPGAWTPVKYDIAIY